MTIRKSIRVNRPAEIAFALFCERIGDWWPKGPSFGGRIPTAMVIEGRVGGRFYQRYTDGTEHEIGRVTVYQPPRVVAFTWRAPSWDADTRVEVRFAADGNATVIELEHSGWERSETAREFRKNYDGGWDTMLGHFQTFAASAA
ncbi:MAG TPA: SRPBCC domain-containing protein [Candidatus Dormibacteraeota bacterium]|nr:SRPBCC domain-containing protein [Candidatus Dormibacteraeota bacterium]